MCPKLSHIHNGRVYTDGLTATYYCKYGYHLNGYEKRTCDDDGRWTYKEPTCESKCLGTSQRDHTIHVKQTRGLYRVQSSAVGT